MINNSNTVLAVLGKILQQILPDSRKPMTKHAIRVNELRGLTLTLNAGTPVDADIGEMMLYKIQQLQQMK